MKFDWLIFIIGLLVGILSMIVLSAGLYIYQENRTLTTDEAVANLVEGNDPNAMDKLAASEMPKGTTTATNEPDGTTIEEDIYWGTDGLLDVIKSYRI